jgi:hypothetical protein
MKYRVQYAVLENREVVLEAPTYPEVWSLVGALESRVVAIQAIDEVTEPDIEE